MLPIRPSAIRQQPDGGAGLQAAAIWSIGPIGAVDDALVPAVDLGEPAEEEQLGADQHRQAGVDQRVDVEGDRAELDRAEASAMVPIRPSAASAKPG